MTTKKDEHVNENENEEKQQSNVEQTGTPNKNENVSVSVSENENTNTQTKSVLIRKLTPQEERKKAILAEKKRKFNKFVSWEKGQAIDFYTSLDDCEYKEVPKFGSQTETETKLVCKMIVPELDTERKKEHAFTPKQGTDLVKVLEMGYTKIRGKRNYGDNNQVKYEFEGLE